jgi:hypothetical protein
MDQLPRSEDRPLGVEILDDGFDDVIAVLNLLEIGDGGHARQGGIAVSL